MVCRRGGGPGSWIFALCGCVSRDNESTQNRVASRFSTTDLNMSEIIDKFAKHRSLGDKIMTFDLERALVSTLDILSQGHQLSANELGWSEEKFFKVLELLNDEELAQGISFSRGGTGNQILIAWYDTASITLKGLTYLKNNRRTTEQTPVIGIEAQSTLFLSYSREDAAVADRIDKHFNGPLVTVKRDIRDVGNWQSIKKFMVSIRLQDFAVLIISESYLKSVNCMYEVMEIMKETECWNRIFTIVLDKSIYSPDQRLAYIKYWEDERDKLKAKIRTIDIANSMEVVADLKKYTLIATQMGEFLSCVADMNNPNANDICKAIEAKIQLALVTGTADLPQEEITLLKGASMDKSGIVIKSRTLDGTSVETNGMILVNSDDRRDIVKWENAIDSLVSKGLLIDKKHKGEIFEISSAGYKVADSIRAEK